MKDRFKMYIKAGYSCLYAISHEEERVTNEIQSITDGMKYKFWTWDCREGLRCGGDVVKNTADPLAALNQFIQHDIKGGEPVGSVVKNKSVLVMKDFHIYLKQSNPVIIRAMKDAITVGRNSNRHIVILGCMLNLPPELEKEVTVMDFPLPDRDELRKIAEALCSNVNIKLNGETEKVLDAGSGLTTSEFADAMAYSLVSTKSADPKVIFQIKTDTIKKNGIIEVVNTPVTLDDVGGL